MPTPTAVEITLSDEERSVLEAWTSRRKTAQALALRARIVLAAAGSVDQRGDRRAGGGLASDGHEVAQPVRRAAAGGAARRAAAGSAADDHR